MPKSSLKLVAGTGLDLAELLESWCRDLRGPQRKSPETLRSYRIAVEGFLRYCDTSGMGRELTKPNVIGWLDTQRDCSAATIRLRLAAVKIFARWLAAEENFDCNPITAICAPKLVQGAVPDLSDDEVRRMVKACAGSGLRDKRDSAILVLLVETGLRAAELLALDITDIDLDACLVRVRHGKGGRPRSVRFSPTAAAAVDRYTRARRTAVHRPAEGPLWLSDRGRRLSYTGLVGSLKARADAAGVVGFHIHRLRHSAAVRWMQSGGSEVGLRAHCGWTSNSMVARYTQAASERLAAEEFDRLNLGLGDL